MLSYQSFRLCRPLHALLQTGIEIPIRYSFLSRTIDPPRCVGHLDRGTRDFHLFKLQSNIHSFKRDHLQRTDRRDGEHDVENIEQKILFNSVLEVRSANSRIKTKIESKKRRNLAAKTALKSMNQADVPIALKYMAGYEKIQQDNATSSCDRMNHDTLKEPSVHLPYAVKSDSLKPTTPERDDKDVDFRLSVDGRSSAAEEKWRSWMRDYDVYDENDADTSLGPGDDVERPWQLDYGTADASVPVSTVPCGGCGALLHCQDTAIPGYLPAELFARLSEAQLRSVTCQRCHFMRHYDTALAVSVGADEYPAVLAQIRDKKALVILVVDLMDFPCSIWPNILDIIGTKRPVVVVGNKVDLLPQDSPGFLRHVEHVLTEVLARTGVGAANVKHVALISAKTGYGIDQLITKLHTAWEYKGDVYLVGCTNVGKSTLFNALLQSDYCKVKAVDLVQRATTSPWPGTTLNLLKFPILRPSGVRMYLRTERLKSQRAGQNAERRLRQHSLRTSRDAATLIGHIGRTFVGETALRDSVDPFSVNALGQTGRENPFGLNPRDREYAESKWCYDTPGTVHPDQILNLLTTEELMLTLPKKLLYPRTFSLVPGSSLFIAGLARLDYVGGTKAIRFTVMASDGLPLTICRLEDADSLHSSLLGSELMAVPAGGAGRLAQWPALVAATNTEGGANTEEGEGASTTEGGGWAIRLIGEDWRRSCADVVLSSAGWVAVTPGPGMDVVLRAWTPGGRGVHVRSPLLPFAVNHRGRRIRRSPAYRRGLGLYKTLPV